MRQCFSSLQLLLAALPALRDRRGAHGWSPARAGGALPHAAVVAPGRPPSKDVACLQHCLAWPAGPGALLQGDRLGCVCPVPGVRIRSDTSLFCEELPEVFWR